MSSQIINEKETALVAEINQKSNVLQNLDNIDQVNEFEDREKTTYYIYPKRYYASPMYNTSISSDSDLFKSTGSVYFDAIDYVYPQIYGLEDLKLQDKINITLEIFYTNGNWKNENLNYIKQSHVEVKLQSEQYLSVCTVIEWIRYKPNYESDEIDIEVCQNKNNTYIYCTLDMSTGDIVKLSDFIDINTLAALVLNKDNAIFTRSGYFVDTNYGYTIEKIDDLLKDWRLEKSSEYSEDEIVSLLLETEEELTAANFEIKPQFYLYCENDDEIYINIVNLRGSLIDFPPIWNQTNEFGLRSWKSMDSLKISSFGNIQYSPLNEVKNESDLVQAPNDYK